MPWGTPERKGLLFVCACLFSSPHHHFVGIWPKMLFVFISGHWIGFGRIGEWEKWEYPSGNFAHGQEQLDHERKACAGRMRKMLPNKRKTLDPTKVWVAKCKSEEAGIFPQSAAWLDGPSGTAGGERQIQKGRNTGNARKSGQPPRGNFGNGMGVPLLCVLLWAPFGQCARGEDAPTANLSLLPPFGPSFACPSVPKSESGKRRKESPLKLWYFWHRLCFGTLAFFMEQLAFALLELFCKWI